MGSRWDELIKSKKKDLEELFNLRSTHLTHFEGEFILEKNYWKGFIDINIERV